MVVLIDIREPEKYYELLVKEGVSVKRKDIGFCDFIVTVEDYSIGVERKTSSDFVASIIDGRIFNQAYMLSTLFPVSYIIVEGSIFDVLENVAFPRRAYIGALASLGLKTSPYGQRGRISVITVDFYVDTVWFLKSLHKHLEVRDLERLPVLRVRKKEIIDERGVLIAMLQAIPGVGEKRARKLAEVFGSVKELIDAPIDRLLMVDGMSYNLARKIKKFLGVDV